MLSAILGWIPLLGPIIQGASSIVGSIANEKVVQMQTGAQVTIAETQAAVQIIQATNDDICIRILRDAICLIPVIWTMLIGWDTIVAVRYHDLMFHVAKYPPSLSYLPYAVMVFLLGNIGINAWKNR